MRKILLLLIFSATLTRTQTISPFYPPAGGTGGGGCVQEISQGPSPDDYTSMGNVDTLWSFTFSTTGAFTLKEVALGLIGLANDEGTIQCRIYANNAGAPGTLLAVATNTVVIGTISQVAWEYIPFYFVGLSLDASTTYHVGLRIISGEYSPSVRAEAYSTGTHASYKWIVGDEYWDDPWTNVDFTMKLYSGTCP